MFKLFKIIIINLFPLYLINGQQQQPFQSNECKKAAINCENSTDCVHRLAVLQSACVTNTCQPQCREAALNLYQNREGRILLRTDASCVPGRYELEKCGLLPNKIPKHCLLAKLICEIDLQCNSKWEVFISECESNTNNNDIQHCSNKCRYYLNTTLSTQQGAAFETCTCTDKEDGRCIQLREETLHPCLKQKEEKENEEDGPLLRPSPKKEKEEKEEEENEIETNNIISNSNLDVPSEGVVGGALSTTISTGGLLFIIINLIFLIFY
ncbi:hypothetical protein Mgra_00002691 [Meloidogyne graminicola]|uniref:GDNF/GAS1 domain-containing protein n=1 Tax=Meloidogyne graminicola TaxID=189291 RepID=A0A8S9ZXY5_9BILA|nr:hypothetical protein Mgra_00002691 [Meloidogyne graminicola]